MWFAGAGTLGQMYISPTRSALIMSLEATSSAFLAYIFLHEVLSISELIGCCFMFSATVLSTMSSAEEEPNETLAKALSCESISQFSDCSEAANHFNFAETSDQLERFLVTKQRSLRRNVVLRRSRSHSDRRESDSHRGVESQESQDNTSHEHTQLLHGEKDPGFAAKEGRHYGSL